MARPSSRRLAGVVATAAAVACVMTATLLTLPVPVAGAAPTGGASWTYTGESDPAFWSTLDTTYATCGAGDRQSLIDVTVTPPVWRKSIGALTRPPVAGVLTPNVAAAAAPLECNSSTPCGLLKWDGTVHALANVHGHEPSEHKLNGVSYPLELHQVHAASTPMSMAVVGVLFRYGPANPLLAKLLVA